MENVREQRTLASEPPLVLVVAFRSDDHLAPCLATLRGALPITVVDNDASTSTRQIAEGSGAMYVSTSANVGFAAAVNLGVREAWDGVSDVLLLNPDARITSTDVGRLQAALHSVSARAAVGPRLVDETGRTQRAQWPMPSPAQVWLDALGLAGLWRGRRFVTGAVLLLRGQALANVGPLDERYFLYAEEADWQLRAQRAGWSVAVVPEITATHIGGASSGDSLLRERLFQASAEMFGRKWYGRRGWLLMRVGSLVASARRSLLGSAAMRRQSRRAFHRYLRAPPNERLDQLRGQV